MYSDRDCFDIDFDFQKHLHLNDVPFGNALQLLFEDKNAQLLAEDQDGGDWLDRSRIGDIEDCSRNEFIQRYTKLPVYSYGTVKAHEYLIDNEAISNAFIAVRKAVDSLADKTVPGLADNISAQDLKITDTLMVFYGADDNAPKKQLPVDIFGLYEWGRLRACGEMRSYKSYDGYRDISDGPQIILDSKKMFGLCGGRDAESLMAVVAIHEFMHSLLDPMNHEMEDNMPHDLLYRHQKEEAWANALTLKSLSDSGNKLLFDYAVKFIASQPKECGYQYGIKFYEDIRGGSKNADGKELWEEWIKEKSIHSHRDLSMEREFYHEVMSYSSVLADLIQV